MNETNRESQDPKAKELRKQQAFLRRLLAVIAVPAALFQLAGASWLVYRAGWSETQVSHLGIAIALATSMLLLPIGLKMAKISELLRAKDD